MRANNSPVDKNKSRLESLRYKLGKTDKQIIRLLGRRMETSALIGLLKLKNGMPIPQNDFWNESSIMRGRKASKYNLDKDFIENLFLLVQNESIKIQQKIFED